MPERKHPLAKCEECPLFGKPHAPTQGPKESDVILVSRSPGYHEAMAGKPFSGPSGKVLDYFLKQNGVHRNEIRVTNTVLCAPKEGKLPKEAIKACSPRLYAELDSADLVIAAGSEAVGVVLGRSSVDSSRGYAHWRDTSDGRSQRVVATNNPALVLRDDSTFPNLQKDFRLAFHPRPEPTLPTVEVIEDARQGKAFLRDIARASGVIAADIESAGGLSHKATIRCIQFATEGTHATVLGRTLFDSYSGIEAELQSALTNDRASFVWHNGKFDIKILRHGYGVHARVDEDTLLLSYALDERPGVHSLEYVLMDELGWPNYEPEIVKKWKKAEGDDEKVPWEEVRDPLYQYAGYDAAGTRQVFDVFAERAKRQDVWDAPYKSVYIPASEKLARMEMHGVIYDTDKGSDIVENVVLPELNQLRKSMQDISEHPILNPRSTKHMPILYYDEWGITHPAQGRPDKERSCDKEAREAILLGKFKTRKGKMGRDDSELRSTILAFTKEFDRFQELDKQNNTYLIGMILKAIKDPDHRIYTDFLIHGTESGRLSSRNPNLQNITRTKEGLPDIRGLFLPSPGRVIVNADYSQAELRCIAKLSGDKELMAVYQDPHRSFHRETAERFYGKDYTPEQYVLAKNRNFGVFYGQSAFSFAQMYHMDQRESQDYINMMWNTYTGVKKWVHETHQEVRKVGKLVNPFGRRRRFYLITEENKDHAFKEAVNFKAQSTASDFTLHAAMTLMDEIDPKRANVIILVHDAIVGDVDESYADEYSEIARQVMIQTPIDTIGWTDIPFAVDIGVGSDWGSAK